MQKYPHLAAHCVHRTGMLEIGDCAVWVGVASRHRDEAFKACRYIIDELKHRLPIWKKEHYTNGDSGLGELRTLRGSVRGELDRPGVSTSTAASAKSISLYVVGLISLSIACAAPTSPDSLCTASVNAAFGGNRTGGPSVSCERAVATISSASPLQASISDCRGVPR